MSFYAQGDTRCSVTPLPNKENRDDQSFATEMFSMEISVSSLVIPQHIVEADSDDDDDSWVYEADCTVEERTFLVARRGLLPPAVGGFLDDMGVPRSCQGFMVGKIVERARCMEHHMSSRKAIHLRVSIDLSPRELMDDDDSEDEGSCLTC